MTPRDARLRGLLWFAWVFGIVALAAFGRFLGHADAITQWQPSWSTLASDWTPVGDPCWSVSGPQLVMRCQSAGIVSTRTWSRQFAIDARVSVSATAVSGGHYFAALAIIDGQSSDTVYGELALANGVPPMQGVPGDNAGTLVDEGFTWYGPIVPGQTYTLNDVWQPSGEWLFLLNGQPVASHAGALGHDPSIMLICASVGEATPDDGSLAECHFGNLSVIGVESGDVRRLWLPAVGGQEGYP